ncbi:MAG: 3-hexulose-6-phosphate synthase [Candidatus Altiarchaeota archaeon]
MKTIIQLALDYTELERALKVAKEAEKSVDWIEAGTPLIKSEGLDAVRRLREMFPKKVIVADMKTMDAGRVEVESAAKAGADVVDVCGQASEATIRECVEVARNYGTKITVDLIGVEDVVLRAKLAEGLGADYVAVHTAIDEQMESKTPFNKVRKVVKAVKIPVLVAGGLNSESVVDAINAGAQVVIIGGAITKAENVRKAASDIRKAVDSGRRVKTDLYRRGTDVGKILSKVSTANVSDAMHRSGDLPGIVPIVGIKAAGKAVTVRTYPGDWAKPVQAIDVAAKGDIIVITSGGVGPAVWGELATESALKKGVAAVVVDGAVRDTDEIKMMKLPVYSKLTMPTAGEPKGFGEINVPIKIGGVGVKPGDWVLCDGDGVVVIPSEKAVEIGNRAQDVLEKENRIRKEIREGSSLGKVGQLLRWEKKI